MSRLADEVVLQIQGTLKLDIEELADPFGLELALAMNTTQAEFFDAFARGIYALGTNYRLQLSWIVDDMSYEAKELIRELHAFIELEPK